MPNIKIVKIPKQITKDPTRQERDKKTHTTYMKRLKKYILEDNNLSTSFSTGNSTLSTSSANHSTPFIYFSTGNSIIRSSNNYIYRVVEV